MMKSFNKCYLQKQKQNLIKAVQLLAGEKNCENQVIDIMNKASELSKSYPKLDDGQDYMKEEIKLLAEAYG